MTRRGVNDVVARLSDILEADFMATCRRYHTQGNPLPVSRVKEIRMEIRDTMSALNDILCRELGFEEGFEPPEITVRKPNLSVVSDD